MHTYLSSPLRGIFSCSMSAVAVAACVAALSPAARAATAPSTTAAVDFAAALRAPLVLPEASSSSIETMQPVALLADPAASEGGGMQPPPYRRRRYGRPSYSDRTHNADGSSRYAFMAGGGFTLPVGDASTNYLKTSWDFGVGGGINLSRKFGVLLQFDWANFGLPGGVLANQETLYDNVSGGGSGTFSGLDGHSHIWSFTLNPTLNFYQTDKLGAYAVVGGGFYHKVTDFTVPSTGTYCDYYGFCYQYSANAVIDHYTSNAPGVSGGLGVTYKFSRFANQRFFAEARYVHTFNQVRYGDPTVTGNANGAVYNFYPPNSNETSYIPVILGIRF